MACGRPTSTLNLALSSFTAKLRAALLLGPVLTAACGLAIGVTHPAAAQSTRLDDLLHATQVPAAGTIAPRTGQSVTLPGNRPSFPSSSSSRRTASLLDAGVRPANFQDEFPAPRPTGAPPTLGGADDGIPSLLPNPMRDTVEPLHDTTDETTWSDPGGLAEPIEPTSPLLEPVPDDAIRGGRVMRLNPLALQQGAANLAVGGAEQTPRRSLGFPFSAIPEHWGHRLPKLKFEFDLPETRHVGRGDPLVGTSWRNRPFHVDALSGAFFGGQLTGNGLEAQNGMLVGTRLGWDFNHYLGAELRLAQADVGLVGRLDRADIRLYDVVVNYYPWGDARIRPFTTFGFGLAEYRFVDTNSLSIQESALSIPFGGGVKFFASRNLALRAELIDNLSLGSSVVSTMNNLSLTGGIELRFGGPRRNYYPYQASPRVW